MLPEGSISPKAQRAVRDVVRKRAHVVRQHTATVLSRQNIMGRHTGVRLSTKRMHAFTQEALHGLLPEAEQVLAVTSSLAMLHGLSQQITSREKAVSKRLKHTPADEQLLRVDGIGEIVAQTMVLETGDSGRLPTVGNSASYCRCVTSTTISHGKRQGQGNVKNGHPYLAWASRESAPCAIRFRAKGQRFSQRQEAQSPRMLARKALAHTRSRACYSIMRDLVPFDVHKACG